MVFLIKKKPNSKKHSKNPNNPSHNIYYMYIFRISLACITSVSNIKTSILNLTSYIVIKTNGP